MADEASKSRKRKMKLEGSKARRKSKSEESLSESSEASDSSSRSSNRYRKKTKSKKKNGRDPGRKRSVRTDYSDQQRSLRKAKRQERHRQQQREDMEKKKRKRKRSRSPIERKKRRRYRSVSTCSDSSRSTSSSYLSDTSCSTCSSTYNSSGERRVKKRRSDSSKRSYRRKGLAKRNGLKEPENKKTTKSYKNVSDDLDTESPNRKAYRHRDSRGSAECCLDNDMSRKRERENAVARDNLLVDGQEDFCDDGKHSSEPLSSVVKFGNEGQKCVDAASDAVALELLLRKKALENLIKFRRFGSGTTKIPMSNESDRPLYVDSRDVDGTGGGLYGTMESRRDEQNLTKNLPDEHPRNGRRDAYREPSKDNILVDDTFGTNGPSSSKHKWIDIGEKESHMESINMNKERKSEMAKVKEPAIETSQECGLRTDSVSNRLACEVHEAHTSKIDKSQTHMLQGEKELQMEIPPLDVITMSSKNKTSKTELTKDDKATTQSLDIDASQKGVPNIDDSIPPKLEGSSFQQKTMAVRQGGETVQVSYKVYIPQRSAALTRRHLKR